MSSQGSLTLDESIITALNKSDLGSILFFQMGWKDSTGSVSYGTSPPWAIVEDETAASELYNSMASSSTTLVAGSTAVAMYAIGTSAPVDVSPFASSAGTITPSAATGTATGTPAPTSSTEASKSGHHLRLYIGAIVGIAIGGFAVLVLISLLIGCCICIRRRRGRTAVAGESSREVQSMQDLMAEKERRAGITENAIDTPYSEAGDSQMGLQRPRARGLGMSGLNGSGVDMSLGPGTGTGTGSIHSGSHFTDTRRGSGAYSSLRGITAVGTAVTSAGGGGDSPTHTHPSSSISLHERSSMMGSPAHRVSSQQDRAFSPYRDHQPATATVTSTDTTADDVDLPDPGSEDQAAAAAAAAPAASASAAPPLPPTSIHDNNAASNGGGGSSSRAGTPQLGPARFVRSATPGGGVSISEQYAHLVEEGMSDEEIRRLEEEERVLDEAIEQARTESRAR